MPSRLSASFDAPRIQELRITLIDGSSAFAELMVDALRLLEPSIPATVNAFDEAVGLDTLVATEPDLIIVDPHVAPGIDGWELIGRAQASPVLAQVPIIICCADEAVVGPADGAATGQMLRLAKPFHLDELHAVLRVAGVGTQPHRPGVPAPERGVDSAGKEPAHAQPIVPGG